MSFSTILSSCLRFFCFNRQLMRKKLCNKFSRAFLFFLSVFTHSFLFSPMQLSLVESRGFPFCFHTPTQEHTAMEIIRKINLFSDGFYFVCCFPLLLFFKINIRHYYVIFSTLFMFYVSLHRCLGSTVGYFSLFSCTTRARYHFAILFGYRQGRKKNFPDDIDLRENATNKRPEENLCSNFSNH